MGLCAGAWMGGKRPAIIMQNTAIGVTINTLATLIQYYRMPLPMIISYRGELREPVACQVEMAVHTKALTRTKAGGCLIRNLDRRQYPMTPDARTWLRFDCLLPMPPLQGVAVVFLEDACIMSL